METMDIAEATQQDIVKTIDGKVYSFKRLTMRDIGSLATAKQQIDVNNLHVSISALTDAGVKPDQLPSVIQELTKSPSYADLMRWAFTPEGALAVVTLANDSADWSKCIDHNAIEFLALDLMGIDYKRKKVESGGSIPFSKTLQETGT